MRATVEHISLPADRRAVAISDIHGNLDYLRGLLDKISFSPADILLLLGDLVEKGPKNLETLQYIIRLCKTHTVHVLRGNCDGLLLGGIPNDWLFRYRTHWHGNLLMNEFSRLLDCPIRTPDDVGVLRERVKREFPEEVGFLMGLPVILVSERYIFVHGGIPGEESLEKPEGLDAFSCMKNDGFLRQGYAFRRRWCVVGHWPVTLYREHWPCANPLVTPERKIVSIDGGCVIKRDGQLNALFLPPEPDGAFSWTAYDALPAAQALDAQAASPDPVFLPFGSAVRVLERGEEFSTCLHLPTGRRLDVLTQDVWETERGAVCEDSTDYELPVRPGDVLSIVQKTSRGWLVKKDGSTGWYRGALRRRDEPCAG